MRSPIKAITALLTLIALAVPTLAGAQDEPTRVLITNANVWNGTSDGLQNGMSVLVEGNLITQIAASIRAPSDARYVRPASSTAV